MNRNLTLTQSQAEQPVYIHLAVIAFEERRQFLDRYKHSLQKFSIRGIIL